MTDEERTVELPEGPAERPPVAVAALWLIGVKLAAHLVTAFATPYEFHRDELLYFSMGTHLKLFGMDFPPFISLLSETLRHTVGVTVASYRITPALFGATVMLLAILIARELGGGKRAQLLTAFVVLLNPLFLRTASLFQPVVIDQFWWLLGFWALLRLINTEDSRWWIVLGVAAGLGLLSKFSILFFGLAVLAALLVSDRRRALLGPWPWIALAIALVIGSPSIIGQIRLGFPVVEQMSGLREGQLNRITFGEHLFEQAIWGPQILLAWGGLATLLFRQDMRRYRMLGWAALAGLVLFAALKGKSYYTGPIHPLLYAAGAVGLERIARARLRMILTRGLVATVTVWGLFILPFGLPILPPQPMAEYAAMTGITAGTKTNWGGQLELPQDYADMLGWEEKAEALASMLFVQEPSLVRHGAVLYGANYGQAGALDLYGRRLGLPPVVSLAGSWYYFGPGDRPGDPIVLLGVEPDELDTAICGRIELATRVQNRWGVPEERDVPIVFCNEPAISLQELWERQGD
ncbi:MAG: glycosyltransferase family 39 protein [marine benthic group bacterium]|nr:glycosyltransferase family 39 protein [Gemmatimonadota bacterium]